MNRHIINSNDKPDWQSQASRKVDTPLGRLAASILFTVLAGLGLSGCSPSEKEVALPPVLSSTTLHYKVTQNPNKDNEVYLESETPQAIPFWDYGSGSSTKQLDTIIFPFSGSYTIHYSVSSAGGFVPGDSTVIQVSKTDLNYLTDPGWGYLAGVNGKTWVLDMTKPIGWYGPDYPKHNHSADDWSWHPDYAGNEWVMPDRDYGSMHFDLINGKNYQVTMIDADGKPTTKKGNFNISTADFRMTLTGGELLYGGDYHGQASNWQSICLLDLSETSITLGVWRDQPNPGDGPCWIGFTYKLKQ